MDFSEQRAALCAEPIDADMVQADPVGYFGQWLKQAIDAGISEPNAMTLATASASGVPSTRTVLLKYVAAEGFVFFTNYSSRKAREIAENPQASLLFPWHQLGREVVVTGTVEKISASESLKYFTSRPHSSQLGAWVSTQSTVIPNRKFLQMKLAEIGNKFKQGKVPLPDFWGGYRVVPEHISFSQAAAQAGEQASHIDVECSQREAP